MTEVLKDRILEKEKKRYAYMLALYELSEGNEDKWPRHSEICSRIGVTDAQTEGWQIQHYLQAEGLAKARNHAREHSAISITHYGIIEIENSVKQPRQATEHFQQQAITMVQNFHGNVGAVQNGNENLANIQQNTGANAQELIQILSQLHQDIKRLPEQKKVEAEVLIADIEEEAKSLSPKPHRMRAFGTALWSVAGPVLSEVSKTYLKQKMGVETP